MQKVAWRCLSSFRCDSAMECYFVSRASLSSITMLVDGYDRFGCVRVAWCVGDLL